MKRYWPIMGLLVVALATIDMAGVSAKERRHGARSVQHAPRAVVPGSAFEPARMYEARPGVWISTYDCITDEGYGRWRPCSSGSGKAGM